jgi:hypothetical protein
MSNADAKFQSIVEEGSQVGEADSIEAVRQHFLKNPNLPVRCMCVTDNGDRAFYVAHDFPQALGFYTRLQKKVEPTEEELNACDAPSN